MPFIERDQANVIVGLYARPQPGRAEEILPDDHAEVVEFRVVPPDLKPLTAEELKGMLVAKGVLLATDRPRTQSL